MVVGYRATHLATHLEVEEPMEAAYDSFSPLLDPRGSWLATVLALRQIRQAAADLRMSGNFGFWHVSQSS
ncbi:hypothetical protein B0O95_105198 [Mycetohabitans endofungorum]|uniref:Uncharacterized protein n=1 Tax=Mycetohabitans endofungorum TaxID=417203 RepID=A0A2P5KBD0_9BURK|nr:hypothetical protein B0O95_105198 [Mycetohabitans endofungorum]